MVVLCQTEHRRLFGFDSYQISTVVDGCHKPKCVVRSVMESGSPPLQFYPARPFITPYIPPASSSACCKCVALGSLRSGAVHIAHEQRSAAILGRPGVAERREPWARLLAPADLTAGAAITLLDQKKKNQNHDRPVCPPDCSWNVSGSAAGSLSLSAGLRLHCAQC